MGNRFRYDAFISYRHCLPDSEIAERLQKKLENFRLPKAIIEKTGPLSSDDSWGSHMEYTSSALEGLSRIGGPRCCKRDGYTALISAIDYVNKRYDVQLTFHPVVCAFSPQNEQCLGTKCPYHP